MQLKNKVIIVTGGAQGIGRALCERFDRESAETIVVADIDEQSATTVANRIGGLARYCDVANEENVCSVVKEVEDTFGRIDLFCANAGIVATGGVETADDQWQRMMDVNFMAHVYSSRAVLPEMVTRGEGYLPHTASAAGLLTQIGSAPYAVSKHAAVALAEWLAITYGDRGIQVSCLCPQGVQTDMLRGDEPIKQMLRADALSVDQVADAVVEGIRDERFLILPHADVSRYIQNKAGDYDRWLKSMRKMNAKLDGQ